MTHYRYFIRTKRKIPHHIKTYRIRAKLPTPVILLRRPSVGDGFRKIFRIYLIRCGGIFFHYRCSFLNNRDEPWRNVGKTVMGSKKKKIRAYRNNVFLFYVCFIFYRLNFKFWWLRKNTRQSETEKRERLCNVCCTVTNYCDFQFIMYRYINWTASCVWPSRVADHRKRWYPQRCETRPSCFCSFFQFSLDRFHRSAIYVSGRTYII